MVCSTQYVPGRQVDPTIFTTPVSAVPVTTPAPAPIPQTVISATPTPTTPDNNTDLWMLGMAVLFGFIIFKK